jgi:hypothetical protein
VAGALNFIGRDTLYGRYWGCIEDHPCLHFELCYYQAIDFAIAHGMGRVEAGAQGQHKLARGYLPVTTHSLHWMRDRGLRRGDRAVSRGRARGGRSGDRGPHILGSVQEGARGGTGMIEAHKLEGEDRQKALAALADHGWTVVRVATPSPSGSSSAISTRPSAG